MFNSCLLPDYYTMTTITNTNTTTGHFALIRNMCGGDADLATKILKTQTETGVTQFHTCDECHRYCYTGGTLYPDGYTCADCDDETDDEDEEEEEDDHECVTCGKTGLQYDEPIARPDLHVFCCRLNAYCGDCWKQVPIEDKRLDFGSDYTETETAPPLKTNFDFITLPKNDNGHYECERCQTEFNDPSEVCWAEVGDFAKDVGVPLCADCCEDQIENWSEINDEE
jgi:hypothetical protein